MTETPLGRKIKEARLRAGLSTTELATRLSNILGRTVHAAWVSQLETGVIARPGKEKLTALAEALPSLDAEELYRLADYGPELQPAGEMIRIPVGDISAGPGIWTEVFEYPLAGLPSRNIVAFHVRGKSMEPEIPEGSMVWADRNATPKPGKLVVAWTEQGGLIKRLIKDGGKLFLKGNSSPPIEVTEDVRIEGVVFFVGHGI